MKHRSRTALVALAFALGPLGCAALIKTWRGHKTPDRIQVPHATHIENDVECDDCHAGIKEATNLAEVVFPKEEVCMECHDDEKDDGNCAFCHKQAEAPTASIHPEHRLNFSHKNHMERVDEDCSRCHKQLSFKEKLGKLPTMDTCMQCHEHREHYDAGECTVCHEDLTRFPLKPVAEFRHTSDWLHRHPTAARSAGEACSTCHEQSFCTDCHGAKTNALAIEKVMPERVDRQFVHRGDFLARHSLEAKTQPGLCLRCHGESFCESCHKDQGLTQKSDDPRSPHPQDWVFPGKPSRHAVAARADITSCAACHDQGANSICVDCHQVGGVGGNPHPASWSRRHSTSEIEHNGMCVACHR